VLDIDGTVDVRDWSEEDSANNVGYSFSGFMQ